MPLFSAFLKRTAQALALPLMALAVSQPMTAEAAAPKAPRNLVVKTTLVGLPPATGTKRYYKLNWEDNSLDESGFRIELRLGNSGPFIYWDTAQADATEYIVDATYYQFDAGTLLQFRVVAFKQNGNKTETSSSNLVEMVVTNGTSNLTAPTNFRVAQVNDGVLRFSWKDRSTAEFYYQIFYKKSVEADTAYVTLRDLHFFDDKEATAVSDRTEVLVKHNLIPGESYNFILRATRRTDGTAASPVSNQDSALVFPEQYPVQGLNFYTVPRLAAPTGLTGERLNAEQVILRWTDNSFNETGYEITYRAAGSDTWAPTDKLTVNPAANLNSYTVGVGPGSDLQWRVRAISTNSDLDVLGEDYSNLVTVLMPFIKPEGLTAVTSGTSGTVELEWQDTSEGETAYDIYTRLVGATGWSYSKTMLADTTRASVTQYYNASSSLVDLEKNKEYEFMVRARYAPRDKESNPSNIATAFVRHGFTSRPYHPAKIGEAFSYTMSVSDNGNRSSWSVSNLPQGLVFNEVTGQITGVPEEKGVKIFPMTVTYAGGISATLNLTLRILGPETLPELGADMPAVTLGAGTQFYIPLEDKFIDPEFEKAVRLNTTMGNIDLMLFDSLAPEAVENFMGYVKSGAYDGVIFHRALPNFIVQGGGFVPVQAPNYFSTLNKRPAPQNEPGIANLRGTVAHAKVPGNPDSATHDFFFNLSDGNSPDVTTEAGQTIEGLDNQNAGFTAFARVAGNGMERVDDIAGLPTGAYGFTPAGKIFVDNVPYSDAESDSAFEDVPMNVTTPTAPPAMDVNATVQIRSAREIRGFDFELENSDPSIARAIIVADGRLRVDGLAPGVTNIKVMAKDLDNNPLEQTFAVTVIKGHKLPVITRQPVSVVVLPGKKATLRVTATGTDIQYQWRKGGENISGATANTLVIPTVQDEQVGEYDVLVSNATTVLTSDTVRVDVRTAPTITLNPPLADRVVEAGKPLVLARTATGAPAPVITWLRSGKTVPKQKAQTLEIPAAAVTDGGSYVMRAKNVAGTVESPPVKIIVVDKTSQLRVTLPNKTVVLTAQASGPDLTYQWKKDGEEIEDDERISGATTAKLTFKKFGTVETDPGSYTCLVRNDAADLEAETGAWNVGLATTAPTLGAFVPDEGYVGIEYRFTIPGGGPSNTTIATFAVTGLPPGLKVAPATGVITGVPRRAGEYTLKVTARNPKGSRSVTNIPMTVLPMPEPVVGAFIGQVGNSSGLNENRGGRIDLFVSEAGAITGKITQGKQVLSFKGEMIRVPGSAFTQGEALVKRPGNVAPLKIVFSAFAVEGYANSGDISGTIYDEVDAVEFVAYRQQYNLAKGRVFPYIGRQHLAFTLNGDDVGEPGAPQGHGYAVTSLDNNGNARVVGRMADGTTLTSSSFLGMQNQYLIFQSQYKHTGTVVGLTYMYYMGAVANGNKVTYRLRSDGQLTWTKLAQTSTKERSYKAGFGPLSMTVLGMTYPNGGAAVAMDLPTNINGNASILFDEGGLENSSIDPDVNPVNIGRTPLIPDGSTNEGDLKLSVMPVTGMFNGSFEVESGRKATFNGIIVPRIPEIPSVQLSDGSFSASVPGVDAQGAGHFLLPKEPAEGETDKTSAILSGSVELKPTPITITTHPLAQAVDPGGNVTFTVVASAPVTLSYRWRKNGTPITGATSSSYSRTNVNENDQATYDVVITSTTSTAISNPAFLDVNDPVSNVVLSRTPVANPVPIGSATPVVFTATAKGAGPFTYRWYKGANLIEGATGSTYTINPVTLQDVGSYSVEVFNSANNDEDPYPKSAPNVLEVANPITTVVAERDPDGTTVNYGATVEFSVASIDSSGPFTYRWYKVEEGQDVEVFFEDGSPANGATFKIEGVASADAGIYKVKVSNAVTTVPVVSNEVPLLVSSGVANVTLTRSPSAAVVLGHSVTFSVSTQGEPQFTYEWYKVVGGVDQVIEGATMSSYVIPAVTVDDAGDYKVLVRNDSSPDGVWSNIRNLEIQPPVTSATITVEGNNLHPDLEDTVTMKAETNLGAVGPFEYQWYQDGSEIEGAINSTYSISPFDNVHYDVAFTVEIGNSANGDSPVMSDPIIFTPPPVDP